MRVLFMGSPEFAVPSLTWLADSCQVLAVFTQPDKRSGRGQILNPPPIKRAALDLGIPVFQPASLSETETIEQIRSLALDLLVVVAYGKILPAELLAIPRLESLNVHASLLPRWRGAAPIQASILAGDEITGISIMKMEAGLDTGPIYLQSSLSIAPEETGGSLSRKLSALGAKTLAESLPQIIDREIEPQVQNNSEATYAPSLKKSDGELDFTQPAATLERQVRAYEPWPGTFFFWKGNRIGVREVEALDSHFAAAGTRLNYNGFPAIATNPGLLILRSVKPAGKNVMAGNVFINGAKGFFDA